jgi:hypothetical protein
MNYEQLLEMLNRIPKERLKDTATVFVQSEDEYFPVKGVWEAGLENDVFDEGHAYIVIE